MGHTGISVQQSRKLVQVGRIFFAVAMMVFGVQQFIYPVSGVGLQFIPSRIPGHMLLAYLSGLLLYVCGMSIALKRGARTSAMLLACFFFLCLLFFHVNRVFANINDLVERTVAFETLALCSGSLIVAGILPAQRQESRKFLCAARKLKSVGQYALGVCMIIFGIDHLEVAQYVATLIPAWIPFHLFWVYFTAFGFIAGSISFLLQSKTFFPEIFRWGGPLLGFMFLLWVVVLHTPRVAANMHNGNEWNSAFVALAMSGCVWLASYPRESEVTNNKRMASIL